MVQLVLHSFFYVRAICLRNIFSEILDMIALKRAFDSPDTAHKVWTARKRVVAPQISLIVQVTNGDGKFHGDELDELQMPKRSH